MKKIKCSKCQQDVDVQETKNKNEFEIISHRRWRSCSEEEYENNVHLRNLTTKTCSGSGEIVKLISVKIKTTLD